MQSLKQYLLNFVEEQLHEYVQNYVQSSITLLRSQAFPVSNQIQANLLYGHIDKLKCEIPWIGVHYGRINCNVQGISLVIRLDWIVEDQKSISFLQKLKMHKLDKEERHILGMDPKSTWYSKILGLLLTSLGLRILSGFTLLLSDIRITLLLPNDEDVFSEDNNQNAFKTRYTAIQLNIDEIKISENIINNSTTTPSSNNNIKKQSNENIYNFSKNIFVQNISLHIDTLYLPTDYLNYNYTTILKHNYSHNILSCQEIISTIIISIKNNQISNVSFDSLFQNIIIQINQNFEIIIQTLQSMKQNNNKYLYPLLKSEKRNYSQLWKFAIFLIINNLYGPKQNKILLLSQYIKRNKMRKKYIFLYYKLFELKLKLLVSLRFQHKRVNRNSQKLKNTANSTTTGNEIINEEVELKRLLFLTFSTEDAQEIENIESSLDYNVLLLCRRIVYRRLELAGISLEKLEKMNFSLPLMTAGEINNTNNNNINNSGSSSSSSIKSNSDTATSSNDNIKADATINDINNVPSTTAATSASTSWWSALFFSSSNETMLSSPTTASSDLTDVSEETLFSEDIHASIEKEILQNIHSQVSHFEVTVNFLISNLQIVMPVPGTGTTAATTTTTPPSSSILLITINTILIKVQSENETLDEFAVQLKIGFLLCSNKSKSLKLFEVGQNNRNLFESTNTTTTSSAANKLTLLLQSINDVNNKEWGMVLSIQSVTIPEQVEKDEPPSISFSMSPNIPVNEEFLYHYYHNINRSSTSHSAHSSTHSSRRNSTSISRSAANSRASSPITTANTTNKNINTKINGISPDDENLQNFIVINNKHIIIELTINTLKLSYDSYQVEQLLLLFTHFKSLINQITYKTLSTNFPKLKYYCAQLSLQKNISNFEVLSKYSIKFSLDINIKEASLQILQCLLTTSNIQIHAGDYLSYRYTHKNQEHQSPNSNIFTNLNHYTSTLLKSLKSVFLVSYEININNIQISIIYYNNKIERNLLEIPVNLRLILTKSKLPLHLKFAQLRMDVFMTSLKLLITFNDLLTITDTIRNISAIRFSAAATPTADTTTTRDTSSSPDLLPIRLKVLSQVCVLKCNINAEELTLSVISDDSNSNRSNNSSNNDNNNNIHNTFKDINLLIKNNKNSTNSLLLSSTYRVVVQKLLATFGLQTAEALTFLNEYITAFQANATDTISLLMNKLQNEAPSSSTHTPKVVLPILTFSIRTVTMSLIQLMYDQRLVIQIGEVLLYDRDHILLQCTHNHIHHQHPTSTHTSTSTNPTSTSKRPRSKSNLEDRTSSSAPLANASKVWSDVAVSFTLIEQDQEWGWGIGGHPTTCLYQPVTRKMYSVRDKNLTVTVKQLYCHISPPNIIEIAEAVVTPVLQLLENIQAIINKTDDSTTTTGSDVLPSTPVHKKMYYHTPVYDKLYSLSCDHISILLTYSSELFSELLFNSISLAAHSKNTRTHSEQQIITVTNRSMDIYDLSTIGRNHPIFLWTETTSSITPPATNDSDNILHIKIILTKKPNKCNLELKLTGLRLFLQIRYLKELISLFTDNLLSPVRCILQQSYDNLNDMYEDSKSETESLKSLHSLHLNSISFEDEAVSTPNFNINSSSSNRPLSYLGSGSRISMARNEYLTEANHSDLLFLQRHPQLRRPSFLATPSSQSPSLLPKSNTTDHRDEIPKQRDSPPLNTLPAKPTRKITWRMHLSDFAIILPRSSFSDDLIATTIKSIIIKEEYTQTSWVAPDQPYHVSPLTGPYYFDLQQNRFQFSVGTADSVETRSTLSTSNDMDDSTDSGFPRHFSSRESNQSISNSNNNNDKDRDNNPFQSNLSLFPLRMSNNPAAISPMTSTSPVFDTKSSDVDELYFQSQLPENVAYDYSSCDNREDDDEDDDNLFQDALEFAKDSSNCSLPIHTSPEIKVTTNHSNTPESNITPATITEEDTSDNLELPSEVFRVSVTMTDAMVLSSLSRPLTNTSDFKVDTSQPLKQFAKIADGQQVYKSVNFTSVHTNTKHTTPTTNKMSTQKWKAISILPFDVVMIIDITENEVKILLSESNVFSPLHCIGSMAEYCLILSVIFDNGYEREQFPKLFTDIIDRGKASPSPTPIMPLEDWPSYGSSAFCQFICHSKISWEFLLIRSDIRLQANMDVNYFESKIQSHEYLDIAFYQPSSYTTTTDWEPKSIPFAHATLLRSILHLKGGGETMRLAIGSGGVELRDCRTPKRTIFPVILRVLPEEIAYDDDEDVIQRTTIQSFADFDFGVKNTPSTLMTPIDQPFKLTLFYSNNHWILINVGVDRPNLNPKNLEVVWIIVDYFSLYFRMPFFGHPGIDAYYASPKEEEVDVYGGVDTRVFVYRPHATIVENPMVANPQTLVLESNEGVFYRYLFDSFKSVKIECNIYNIAAVLMKHYRSPTSARGLRGSSGSGRGVRTVLEYFTALFSYNLDTTQNHVDILVNLSPQILIENIDQQTTHSNLYSSSSDFNDIAHGAAATSTYIDLDQESLSLPPPRLWEPKCINPLVDPPRNFPSYSCDLVASLEDFLLSGVLFTEFWGWNVLGSNPKGESSGGGGGGDSSNQRQPAPLPAQTSLDYTYFATDATEQITTSTSPSGAQESTFLIVYVNAIKFILVDNILGLHLPFFQVYVQNVSLAFEVSPELPEPTGDEAEPTMTNNNNNNNNNNSSNAGGDANLFYARNTNNVNYSNYPNANEDADADADATRIRLPNLVGEGLSAKLSVSILMWSDYFNDMLKCWEPLLDPLTMSAIVEQSSDRGLGLTVRSSSFLHCYFTDSLLRMLLELQRALEASYDMRQELTRISSIGKSTNNMSTMNSHNNHNDEVRDSTNTSPPFDWVPHRGRDHTRDLHTHSHGHLRTRHSTESMIYHDFQMHRTIPHIITATLSIDARVGFSLQNMTGLPLRFLQEWEGRQTVHYLRSYERGLLNFVASKTVIRDNKIAESAFSVQRERGYDRHRVHRLGRGHDVSFQLCGYNWLWDVQADHLGIKFKSLTPVIGRVSARNMTEDKWLQNALKLVTEVCPHNGGRMLLISSVFRVRNETNHKIEVLTHEDSNANPKKINDTPFLLHSGETFHLPITLLHRSMTSMNSKSLGCLWIRPSESSHIRAELGDAAADSIDNIEFSSDPINLRSLVLKTAELYTAMTSGGDNVHEDLTQLSCLISTKALKPSINTYTNNSKLSNDNTKMEFKSNSFHQLGMDSFSPNYGGGGYQHSSANINVSQWEKLPPLCYVVEVRRGDLGEQQSVPRRRNASFSGESPGNSNALRIFSAWDKDKKPTGAQRVDPIAYTIVIHPPIVLESLLPSAAFFELATVTQHRVLWSSKIDSGEACSIHTVSLEEPLVLQIDLGYCRSEVGVQIHKPDSRPFGGPDAAFRSLGDLLLSDDTDTVAELASVVLSDPSGQRLRLNVENILGGGGQRHLIVFCPFWVVNASQYSIRLKEDGSNNLPAGSYTDKGKKGEPSSIELQSPSKYSASTTIPSSQSQYPRSSSRRPSPIFEEKAYLVEPVLETVFPGRPGPLHSTRAREFSIQSPLKNLLKDHFSFEEMASMASMFNFSDDSRILGQRKVVAQLDDSDWSTPFSLRSLEVNQMLAVEDPTDGKLEVSFKIKLAPNRLAKYTKIIKFYPRYIIINKLSLNATVRQISSLEARRQGWKRSEESGVQLPPHRLTGTKAGFEVSAAHIRPFHFSNIYTEHLLAINFDGLGKDIGTTSFSINQLGSHTLRIKQPVDLLSLPYVRTRLTPEYEINFPPGELGIWFETDWNQTSIIVKGVKPGCYAALKTDIEVGDELLAVNGEEVSGSSFDHAIELIRRNGQAQAQGEGCLVRLRTVEEKLRNIREQTMLTTRGLLRHHAGGNRTMSVMRDNYDLLEENHEDVIIRVNLRIVDASTVLTLSPVKRHEQTDYRVDNFSTCHWIHFKQRAVTGVSWNSLSPGTSMPYIWEDPFLPHRLLVRVGSNVMCPSKGKQRGQLNPNDINTIKNNDNINSNEPSDEFEKNHALATQFGYVTGPSTSDANSTLIMFDEFGFTSPMTVPGTNAKLIARVVSDGYTKVLTISSEPGFVQHEINYSKSFAEQQIEILRNLRVNVNRLQESKDECATPTIQPSPSQETSAVSELATTESTTCRRLNAFRRQALLELKNWQKTVEMVSKSSVPNSLPPTTNKIISSKQLVSHAPIRSLLGPVARHPHQLLVEVVEAKGLQLSHLSGSDYTYCMLYIKSQSQDNVNRFNYFEKRFTYICDEGDEPKWVEQKFIFDVSESAIIAPRNFKIRVKIKNKNTVGLDPSLGYADIPFSCLAAGKEVEGWIPLRSKNYSIESRSQNMQVIGSVKLRLHWVRDETALFQFIFHAIDRRIQSLSELHGRLTEKFDHRKSSSTNPIYYNYHYVNLPSTSQTGSYLNQLQFNKRNKPKQGNKKKISFDCYHRGSSLLSEEITAEELEEEEKKEEVGLAHGFTLSAMDSLLLDSPPETPTPTLYHKRFHTSMPMMTNMSTPAATPALHRRFESSPHHTLMSTSSNVPLLPHVPFVSSLASPTSRAASPSSRAEYLENQHHHQQQHHSPPRYDRHSTPLTPITPPPGSTIKAFPPPAATLAQPIVESRDSQLPTRLRSSSIAVHIERLKSYRASIRQSAVPKKNMVYIHRQQELQSKQQVFLQRFQEECGRNFAYVSVANWLVNINPIEAINLRCTKYRLFVKICYGSQVTSTSSCPPTAQPTWAQSEVPYSTIDKLGSRSNSGLLGNGIGGNRSSNIDERTGFKVDMNNVNINFEIQVRAENFPNNIKIASVNIPIHNLLDCLITSEGLLDKWFPLSFCSPHLNDPVERDPRFIGVPESPESRHYLRYGAQPCIRLQIRWSPIYTDYGKSRLYARLQLPSLSVSVIDSTKAREVLLLTVKGIEAKCIMNHWMTDIGGNIATLQLDNQLPFPVVPVVLMPTYIKHPQPTIRFNISRNNAQSREHFEFLKSFTLVVQELDLHLEQQTVLVIWDLLRVHSGFDYSVSNDKKKASKKVSKYNFGRNREGFATYTMNHDSKGFKTSQKSTGNDTTPPNNKTAATATTNTTSHQAKNFEYSLEETTDQLYVEFFFLSPIKVNVSLLMTPQALTQAATSTSSTTERNKNSNYNIINIPTGPSSLSLFLWQVVEVILELTSSVSDAPIKLNGIEVENMYQTKREVFSRLQEHYFNAALGQLYKVLGSLELVGNPVALVSSLGNGVFDFFYEPTKAIVANPTELGKIGRGVVKGTLSLVGNATDGTIGTATTIFQSVGKGLATLSMDPNFLQNRDILRKQPTTVMGTLRRPLLDISNGIYCGVVGVVRVPYQNVRRYGAAGIPSGLVKGCAGVAAKPIVGVLDAVTHIGDVFRLAAKTAIRNSQQPVHRQRLVALFGPDGRLLPYYYETALGTYALKHLLSTHSSSTSSTSNCGGCLPSGTANADIIDSQSSSRIEVLSYNSRNLSDSIGAALPTNYDKSRNRQNEECVVYTAVIPKDSGAYHLIIISTYRIVIVEYRNSLRDVSLAILWQCELPQLKEWEIERSIGGTKVALKLVMEVENDRSSGGVNKKTQPFREYGCGSNIDSESILRVFNCICAIKNDFRRLYSSEFVGVNYTEDQHNALHFGQWEYVAKEKLPIYSNYEKRSHDGISLDDADEAEEEAMIKRMKSEDEDDKKYRHDLEVSSWDISLEERESSASDDNSSGNTSIGGGGVGSYTGIGTGVINIDSLSRLRQSELLSGEVTTETSGSSNRLNHEKKRKGSKSNKPPIVVTPYWLQYEVTQSMKSHKNIKELIRASRSNPNDNETIQLLKGQLRNRLITYDEFFLVMERDFQYGDEIRRSDNSVSDKFNSLPAAHHSNTRSKDGKNTGTTSRKSFSDRSSSGIVNRLDSLLSDRRAMFAQSGRALSSILRLPSIGNNETGGGAAGGGASSVTGTGSEVLMALETCHSDSNHISSLSPTGDTLSTVTTTPRLNLHFFKGRSDMFQDLRRSLSNQHQHQLSNVRSSPATPTSTSKDFTHQQPNTTSELRKTVSETNLLDLYNDDSNNNELETYIENDMYFMKHHQIISKLNENKETDEIDEIQSLSELDRADDNYEVEEEEEGVANQENHWDDERKFSPVRISTSEKLQGNRPRRYSSSSSSFAATTAKSGLPVPSGQQSQSQLLLFPHLPSYGEFQPRISSAIMNNNNNSSNNISTNLEAYNYNDSSGNNNNDTMSMLSTSINSHSIEELTDRLERMEKLLISVLNTNNNNYNNSNNNSSMEPVLPLGSTSLTNRSNTIVKSQRIRTLNNITSTNFTPIILPPNNNYNNNNSNSNNRNNQNKNSIFFSPPIITPIALVTAKQSLYHSNINSNTSENNDTTYTTTKSSIATTTKKSLAHSSNVSSGSKSSFIASPTKYSTHSNSNIIPISSLSVTTSLVTQEPRRRASNNGYAKLQIIQEENEMSRNLSEEEKEGCASRNIYSSTSDDDGDNDSDTVIKVKEEEDDFDECFTPTIIASSDDINKNLNLERK